MIHLIRINFKYICGLASVFLISCLSAETATGQSEEEKQDEEQKSSPEIKTGFVRQFDADLDKGGKISADRFFLQGKFPVERWLSLSLGYRYDGYDFSGAGTFSGLMPWKDVHTYSLGTSLGMRFGDDWKGFAIPTIRLTGESGADAGDSLTGGAMIAAYTTVTENLTIGPGIGLFTDIEDDLTVFPVIIINWKINEHLSLDTGQGRAATKGPGLFLNWKVSEPTMAYFGGRYENLRFRLDETGSFANGVGEEKGGILVFGFTHRFSADSRIDLLAGYKFAGELRLEDKEGNLIAEEDYDSAFNAGISFTMEF